MIAASSQAHLAPDGWGIRVTTGSRLSFTLIDLSGECGRRNGMASMSLAKPYFCATMAPAARLSLRGQAGHAPSHAEEILDFVGDLRQALDGPAVAIQVENSLPMHQGFGSKTTTLLALGRAYATLCGSQLETEALAQLARRAGTSGASVNLIDRGGFLVDGGHANPDDFAQDPQRYLVPSRFAGAARKPPVLISAAFPPWPILVVIGKGTELHGQPELDWFRQTLPIPAQEAQRTAHFVLMNLATAVVEADYPRFCRALDRLTFDMYYKQEQIKVQSSEIRNLLYSAREQPMIDAVGMSVTGPMCFMFTRQPKLALRWLAELKAAGQVVDYYFSSARNTPITVEGVAFDALDLQHD